MHVPRGYTYAIDRIYSYGSASLADGASATVQTSHYFAGAFPTARTRSTFQGPREQDWWVAEEIDYSALVWAPCGEHVLNANTELRVSAGDSDPTITSSSISRGTTDGSIDIYHLTWKRC